MTELEREQELRLPSYSKKRSDNDRLGFRDKCFFAGFGSGLLAITPSMSATQSYRKIISLLPRLYRFCKALS